MVKNTWLVYVSVFVCLFMPFVCQIQKPVFTMEYKVLIEAGKDECFTQRVEKGSGIFVSFQVIRGDEAGFIVRHSTGDIVHPYKKEMHSFYSNENSTGGHYDVCIDNQFSTFHKKLVTIYISVVKYDDWHKYVKELDELHVNVQNFTHVVSIIERNVHDMLYFQSSTRGREARDMALLLDNELYVQNWSIAQIIVIILASILQVYILRRFFDVKTGNTRSQI